MDLENKLESDIFMQLCWTNLEGFFNIFALLISFQRFKMPGEVLMLEENLWLSIFLPDNFRPWVRVILFQVNGFAVLFHCFVFLLFIDTLRLTLAL